MAIVDLALSNFRNYTSLYLSVSSRPVVLWGENGSGKTNVLEALSLLSPGKGLRKAALKNLINQQNPVMPWALSATLCNDVTLGSGLETTSSDNRLVKVQGVKKNQRSLQDHINILWVTPQTELLFQNSPSDRRRFMDQMIQSFDADHSKRLYAYENLMKQRMILLKQNSDPLWIESLEKKMAPYAVAITLSRHRFAKILNDLQHTMGNLPGFTLSWTGDFDNLVPLDKLSTAEDYVIDKLKQSRPLDKERGMTHFGPHKSDIDVVFHPKNMSIYCCSTGEQTITLISILLCFIEKVSTEGDLLTLLLLDDVVAHLDFSNRMLLFEQLCNADQSRLQAWMTGTDRSDFDPLVGQADFYEVKNAALVPGL